MLLAEYCCKRGIELWEGHRAGFRSGPAELPRRLVAVGDRVYTLGYGQPSVMPRPRRAGRPRLRRYGGYQEIMVDGGKIYLVVGHRSRGDCPASWRVAARPPKCMLALNADSGELL
jgi:hypothetical protein